MKILLLSIALFFVAKASRQCERIKVTSCQDIGYNYTSMPNFAFQGSQADAEMSLRLMEPLFRMGCSPNMRVFACAAYVPMCREGLHRVGPCRGLCEKSRALCAPLLARFGFLWPRELDCEKFYHEDDKEQPCIMGPLIQ